MPFHTFTNPFRDGASIPELYRTHHQLQGLFQAGGTYRRPVKDPVTLWAIDILRRDYGVPLQAIEVELQPELPQSGLDQGRADVVIYDDRFINSAGKFYVAFIVVEVMEPGKTFGGTEAGGWHDHYDRLCAFMNLFPSARYAILTSGTNTLIYRGDPEYPRLEEIGDLPPYLSVR